MNTHEIELPPLPPGYKSYEFPDGGYDADEMQAYARAAIEAYSHSPISNNDDCRSLSAKTDRQPIYQIRIAGERGYAWLDVDEQQYEIFGQYPILFERRVVYEQN